MGKPKAKTLQQRFGFADPQLSTPKHDEMMLWLDTNADSVLAELLDGDGWDIDYHLNMNYEGLTKEELLALPKPDKPGRELIKLIWEHPITTQQTKGYGNKYTVGFVDMVIAYQDPYLKLAGIEWPRFGHARRNDEDLEWFVGWDEQFLAIEVKPTIPSLGELIRQIRMYGTYTDLPFAVLCPESRFRESLKSQGIHFYQYPGGHP